MTEQQEEYTQDQNEFNTQTQSDSIQSSANPIQDSGRGTGGVDQATWKYGEGVPGSGDVPEWFLADKYKSVEEQAKAALELRKKLGSKVDDAPEHYDIDVDKYGWQKDDPILNEFNGLFKEMNLPQKDYEKLLDKYHSLYSTQAQQKQETMQKQLESFSAENPDVLNRVQNWVGHNFDETEQGIVNNLMQTPEGIRVLDKMRGSGARSAPPTADQAPMTMKFETLESVEREIRKNWQQFKDDDLYRADLEKRRRKALMQGS